MDEPFGHPRTIGPADCRLMTEVFVHARQRNEEGHLVGPSMNGIGFGWDVEEACAEALTHMPSKYEVTEVISKAVFRPPPEFCRHTHTEEIANGEAAHHS